MELLLLKEVESTDVCLDNDAASALQNQAHDLNMQSGNRNALSRLIKRKEPKSSSCGFSDGSSSRINSKRIANHETEILQIDHSRVEQVQMLSDFLERHFTLSRYKDNLEYTRASLKGLPETDFYSNPMLYNAVQAICLAHTGSKYNENRLVLQSRVSYGKVLAALVRIFERSAVYSDHRVVVPSIMLLCLCEVITPGQSHEKDAWRAHYWGVHEYLKVCGPSCFDMASPFGRLLLFNLRVPTLFLGLARRKAIILGEPQWTELEKHASSSSHSLAALFRLALQITGLLEKSDLLIRQKPLRWTPRRLMRDFMQLRADMSSWSVNESSFSDKATETHNLVNGDMAVLDMDVEEHVVLSTSAIFSKHFHFHFPSYRIAEDMTLFWMFNLIIDATLLRLMHFAPFTASYIQPRTRKDTLDAATTRARYLCRSV